MNNSKEDVNLINALSELRSIKPNKAFIDLMQGKIDRSIDIDNPSIFSAFTFSLRLALLTLSIFIFSGSSVVLASQRSQPGDFLYPIKQIIRDAQISLSSNPSQKALLHLERSEDKIIEIKRSVKDGDLNQMKKSLNEYTETVEKVIQETKTSQDGSNLIYETVVDSLENQEKALQESKNHIPPEIQPAMDNAIDTSSQFTEQVKGETTEFTGNNEYEVNKNSSETNIPNPKPSPVQSGNLNTDNPNNVQQQKINDVSEKSEMKGGE